MTRFGTDLFANTYVSELCVEAQGNAVIDSACASNVAGSNWYNHFVENLLSSS